MITSVEKARTTGLASTSAICNGFMLKRDAYYKYHRRFKTKMAVEEKVLKLVRVERRTQPRVGTRKLHVALQKDFEHMELKVGRDRLFKILRQEKMLVCRKRAYAKTR